MILSLPKKLALLMCASLFSSVGMSAYDAAHPKNLAGGSASPAEWKPVFPQALFRTDTDSLRINAQGLAGPIEYKDILKNKEQALNGMQSVLLNSDVFALYGKPNAYTMGILGQYSLEAIEPIMNEFVKLYDKANGQRNIIPAFYIIYGTCWPEGEIGILSSAVAEQYISFAAARGWYVFLDHQIGKYTVTQAMEKLLPFLKYPNVHLALDPEWRTEKPMKEIGYVTAEEVNQAQQLMQDYMIQHGIGGRRMLVIHQFNAKMIKRRHLVKSNYERVQLIHCSDGFGPPQLKKDTYAYNAAAKNIPLKSFKLFLKPTVAGAGYDIPIMKPEEVFSLNPRPYLIMYQ
ncbi:MAG: hypothetical protein P1P65_01160 [Treponema sp.]